jgi:hypothetical protein
VETPVAIEECLALGLEGMRGIVVDSKTYSRRTLVLCLERKIRLVTLVPRTCTLRQDLEAWGRQQPALTLLVEKPGRTQDEAPQRWHGQSVLPCGPPARPRPSRPGIGKPSTADKKQHIPSPGFSGCDHARDHLYIFWIQF